MKHSGVQWIGDIPKDWDIDTIGNLYTLRNEKVSDKDYPPLSVSKMGVVPQLETAAKTDDGDNRKLVKVGDFAINSRSDRRGSCGISAYDGSVSLINTVITPREQMNPRFYSWLFHSELFADEFYKWGHGIVDDLWTTRWQEMKRISIVAPSSEEQQKIASFLDRKCCEIDEMIALQEKIIEELKAYKQSVITEAVTKGLNPDVPMKDSGIEWIGEIPEHWKVDLLSLLFEEHKQRNTGLLCKNLLSLSYGKIVRKNIDSVGGLLPQSYDGYNIVDKGDIVFRLTDLQNDKKSLRTGLVRERGIVTSAYVTLRSRKPVLSAYYQYLFHSYDVMKVFYGMGDGVRQGMNYGDLRKMLIVTPPHSEQNEIVEFLDTKCTEIDNLISIKLSKIDSLKEYKKSIIYEYITGKKEVTE